MEEVLELPKLKSLWGHRFKVRLVDRCLRGLSENGGTSAALIGDEGLEILNPDGSTANLSHGADTSLFQLPCLLHIQMASNW